MSSTIEKEPTATEKKDYYRHKPADDDASKVNSGFPEIADRRRRRCVHAPPAARVYLPYLHMLLFTPEGKMSRLHLNTEITAMPDSDKPRPPRPPASSRAIFFSGIYSEILKLLFKSGRFLVIFPSGGPAEVRGFIITRCFLSPKKGLIKRAEC